MNKKEKTEIFYELQKSQKNWEKGLDHKNQKTKFQISKRKNQKFSTLKQTYQTIEIHKTKARNFL